MIDRGKRSKSLNEVKPVENINKNPQNFLKISPVQMYVPPLHKLQDHTVTEETYPSQIKGR